MQNRCYKQIFSILNNAMNICVNKQQVRTGCKAVQRCRIPSVSQQSALIRHTVHTESDDTRCCDNTICPLLKVGMLMLETCRGL